MGVTPARVRVPVVEVAAEAWRFVFGRFGLVLELVWLPLLVLLAAAIVPELLLPPAPEDSGEASILGANLPAAIVMVAQLLCLSAIAVRLQQTLLYGRSRIIPPRLFPRAYARFVVYGLVVNLVAQGLTAALLVAAFAAGEVPVGWMVAGVVLMALLGLGATRLALLFPAAAFGEPLDPRAAWRLMRGNTWRLIGCSFLTCVPFVVAVALVFLGMLAGVQAATDPAPAQSMSLVLLRGVVGTVANVIVVALGAAILCGFFRRIALLGVSPSAEI